MGRSTVDLVDYTPEWATAYQVEEAALRTVLGARALVIEHIGSTSVPGLMAKPTIDIAVGVTSLADALACREALEGLGYEFRDGMHDEHLVLRKIVADERTHHLHFRVYPADEFDDWTLFRDLLREDDDARSAYERTKRELAARFYNDRGSYVEAKTDIVRRLVAEARARYSRPTGVSRTT